MTAVNYASTPLLLHLIEPAHTVWCQSKEQLTKEAMEAVRDVHANRTSLSWWRTVGWDDWRLETCDQAEECENEDEDEHSENPMSLMLMLKLPLFEQRRMSPRRHQDNCCGWSWCPWLPRILNTLSNYLFGEYKKKINGSTDRMMESIEEYLIKQRFLSASKIFWDFWSNSKSLAEMSRRGWPGNIKKALKSLVEHSLQKLYWHSEEKVESLY